MEQKRDKKIEEILQSLDGVEKATPGPYFFTRLEARMQRGKNFWEKVSSFVAKPVYAFACICLLILINASVILFTTGSKNSTDQQGNEAATVDEYNSVSSTFYEFVNSKP
ncbi:MAG: hypothetical protein ABI359_13135 [Ginsengibacter sp.]